MSISYRSFLAERIRKEAPLKVLTIEQQVIDGLPDELWLQPIEQLCLVEVSFECSFPKQIFELAALKELRLCCVAENNSRLDSGNYISEIPFEVSNLKQLLNLVLLSQKNKITTLITSLAYRTVLGHLSVWTIIDYCGFKGSEQFFC